MAESAEGSTDVDSVTGLRTTGHSWDGIQELNRPLPRWWLITFYATIVFAVGYAVLYPSIPLLRSSTPGVLGYSTRGTLEHDLVAARAQQAGLLDKVSTLPLTQIVTDRALLRFATAGGRSAFSINCAPCHGTGAAGSPGYANLNDDDWLWGGDIDSIFQTISFGVRSNHPDTRQSVMPNFGADGTLTQTQVEQVAEYVLSLANRPHDPALSGPGKDLFADYCAGCHGEEGAGNRELGAPDFDDAIWLYGNDRATIKAQIYRPRMGVMPAWAGRLDNSVLKELAVFVYSLGGGEAATR